MFKKTRFIIRLIVGIVAALLYVILPTDAIFDGAPVIGWVDDIVAVLLAVVNAIQSIRKICNK